MGEEPDEVEGAGQGRACVSGDEAEVRVRESALLGIEEERAPLVCHLRPGESVSQSQEVAAGSVVFVCSARRPRDGKGEAKQVRGFDSHIGRPVS